jgi:Glycoside-hydrolase family GH114
VDGRSIVPDYFRRCWGALGLAVALALACDGTEGVLVELPASGEAGESGSGAAGSPSGEPGETPYVPAESARWLARLDGAVDIGDEADFFYLDAEQQQPEDLAELRRQGRHYLCYLSVGSFEAFRDDADQFPEAAIGNPLSSFPSERWLDIRDATVRELMAARIERLAALGCAGVPPSSLAAHTEDSGFALTASDALDYARWVAERLHAAGMSAGLIGPGSLTSELWPSFDFGLAIGCVAGSQCAEYDVFRQSGRPVFYVELGGAEDAPELCNAAKQLGFDAIVTDAGFGGDCVVCRDIL